MTGEFEVGEIVKDKQGYFWTVQAIVSQFGKTKVICVPSQAMGWSFFVEATFPATEVQQLVQ